MASVAPNGSHPLTGRLVVTGGGGFLCSRVGRRPRQAGASDIFVPRSDQFDLVDRDNCREVVKGAETVVHLAARVGGIGFHRENPGQLFFENLMMGAQLMEESRLAGVKKFVAVGTVCAYPKFTPVPFREEDLWNGYPDETNAPYGLAKKMLLVQSQAYREQYGFNSIFLLPVNLYGPRDNFDPSSSHVIPALIRKCVEAAEDGAPEIVVWGTGPATLGTSTNISMRELATLIAGQTGFAGRITWDTGKPDGQPRRMLDTDRAAKYFGFVAKTSFEEGLRKTIDWYRRSRLSGAARSLA